MKSWMSICIFVAATLSNAGCAVAGDDAAVNNPADVAPSAVQQNVVVVVDDSGSMAGQKMADARSAVKTVINQLPSNTKIGIYALNMGWVHQIDPNDNSPLDVAAKQQVNAKVDQIGATGGTPLGEAMKQGADNLFAVREEQNYGTYKLLLITDGEANDQRLVEQYLPLVMARGVTVECVGVQMNESYSLATKVNRYTPVQNRDQLATAVSQVFAEVADTDESQTDFELLQPVPYELAAAALTTLSKTSMQNHPLGEEPPPEPTAVDAGGVSVTVDDEGNLAVEVDENGNVVQPNQGGGNSGMVFLVLLAIGAVIAIVVIAVKCMS